MQLRALGASCDWRRERFTFDKGLSAAVAEVFVRLYEKDLIYRGLRIINWCPRCQTALSDEEAPMVETDGTVRGMDFAGTCSGCGARLTQSGGAHVPDTEPARMLCGRCCADCKGR